MAKTIITAAIKAGVIFAAFRLGVMAERCRKERYLCKIDEEDRWQKLELSPEQEEAFAKAVEPIVQFIETKIEHEKKN